MVFNQLHSLALAERHIKGAKLRISQQRARIEGLIRDGRDTDRAERLVVVMESTLRCYETHKQLIQDRIRWSRA